nr:type II toxin-antitoxin system prevent-host-death family antitoxin [Phreatobacter sp.]
MSAREAKNAFGLLIDTARAEPVMIEKHGRGVVVVVAVEEYERLAEHAQRSGTEANKKERLKSGGHRGGAAGL